MKNQKKKTHRWHAVNSRRSATSKIVTPETNKCELRQENDRKTISFRITMTVCDFVCTITKLMLDVFFCLLMLIQSAIVEIRLCPPLAIMMYTKPTQHFFTFECRYLGLPKTFFLSQANCIDISSRRSLHSFLSSHRRSFAICTLYVHNMQQTNNNNNENTMCSSCLCLYIIH